MITDIHSADRLVQKTFAKNGKRPTPAHAKLLLGPIIADPLLLTSPTTTEVDRQQAAALARLAKVKLQEFGREVLVRNDETLDRSAAELVEKDLKEFSGSGVRFAVAQIETVDRSRIDNARLKKFASALHERRQRGGWEFAALLLTDIFAETAWSFSMPKLRLCLKSWGRAGRFGRDASRGRNNSCRRSSGGWTRKAENFM